MCMYPSLPGMHSACALLCCYFWPAWQHQSSHKSHVSRGKSFWTENVFWFSLQFLSKIILILRRIELYNTVRVINVNRYSYKIPIFLVRLKKTWNMLCVRVLCLERYAGIPLQTERTYTQHMLCCRITTLTFYIFNKF